MTTDFIGYDDEALVLELGYADHNIVDFDTAVRMREHFIQKLREQGCEGVDFPRCPRPRLITRWRHRLSLLRSRLLGYPRSA